VTAAQATATPQTVTVGGSGWDFNAAHTGLHDGLFEPLHGHTYNVVLTAVGHPDQAGMVADFRVLKDHLRAVLRPLKRRTLIACETPGVTVTDSGEGQITVAGAGALFTLPRAWVTLLPLTGTSTEALAAYLVQELARRLGPLCPGVQRLTLSLSESAECAATAEAILR
jgi:6-pyruvoyl-tetrahydropterin synthase